MRRLSAVKISPTLWVAVVALVFGFALGRGWPLAGTTAATLGQATPAPECLPSPAASPVALASPVAAGQPLPYQDDWTVEVTGATKMTAIGDYAPEGVFVVVNLTITNGTVTGRFFPFEELVLLDEQGRPFALQQFLTNQFPNSRGIHHTFQPSLPTDTAVIFDVAEDAGDTFILQSTADPTFRVQVDLALRGDVGGQA